MAFLNFAIGNLAIDYATGLAGPLIGTAGNIIADSRMARVGLQGAAESANAARRVVQTVSGTKQLVKAGLDSLGLKPAQAANIARALDRAGNNATVTVETLADGSVQVTTGVPGRAGGFANYSKVIDASGQTVPGSVVQSAYNPAGSLVHYDPKF
ncbi:MAG: hypothetical protein M3Y72_21555 [Acidobacteriota bacterium]|nr:hypothetical protein [Acidobacteriota bacterium]